MGIKKLFKKKRADKSVKSLRKINNSIKFNKYQKEIQQKIMDLSLINVLNYFINQGHSLDKIINFIGKKLKEIYSCYRVSIYLKDTEKNELILYNTGIISKKIINFVVKNLGIHVPEKIKVTLTPKSRYQKMLKNGKPQLINNPAVIRGLISEFTVNKTQKKFIPIIFRLLNIHSIIAVPLISKESALGLIELSNKKLFSRSDLIRLRIISEQLTAIIKRKKIEDTLIFEQAQLLSIFDSINEVIYVADPATYKILYANKFAQYTFKKRLIGHICYKELQGRDSPCSFCTNKIILKEKSKPYQWEFHNPILNKDYFIIDRIIKWPDGRDARFEIAIDITERKKLLEQLSYSEKLTAVGQLGAGIAHEFNNILTVISGNIELLLPEVSHNNKLTETLNIIEKQAQRGADIVANIMAFSQPKEPIREIYDISKIIDNVLRFEEKFLQLENIKILKDYSFIHETYIDIGQMEQVFLNLINNARHAIKPKGRGTIFLSIKENNDNLVVSVRDNGIGMNEEIKKNIFNPFFTTKKTYIENMPEIKGTGLGLSVSFSIIKNHNGTITVESKKNRGADFIITLPLALPIRKKDKEQAKKGEITQKESNEIIKLKILIIDDEKEITELLTHVFEQWGYRDIRTAISGKEGLLIFNEEDFDVVFLDILMPDMDGKEVFKELKKINPDIPIICMSGQMGFEKNKEIRKKCYTALQKPFRILEIFELLNKIGREHSRAPH